MAVTKILLNTKPSCSLRSSMSTLNLFTTSINTITEEKANVTLQRLLLFSLVDDLTSSAPCSLSQGCRRLYQTLPTSLWTQGTVRPFAPRINDAEFLTSHHRTSMAAFPNTPAASMLPQHPTPPAPCLAAKGSSLQSSPCTGQPALRAQVVMEGSRGHQPGQSTSQPP